MRWWSRLLLQANRLQKLHPTRVIAIGNDSIGDGPCKLCHQLADKSGRGRLAGFGKNNVDAAAGNVRVFLRDHFAWPKHCRLLRTQLLLARDALHIGGKDIDMNLLRGILSTQGLDQKQQAVEAELQRSFVSLEARPELAFVRYAPKVNDALGSFFCARKLFEKELIIFRTLRIDRERLITQSFKLFTHLHGEHIVLRLLETLHNLWAKSCSVD